VDDEEGPRESLRVVFKERFQCLTARSGQEGIELARHHPVDVAIIDIKMPDISGTEVLREIKSFDSNVECIMLTGYETLETARAAVRYGASDYLNKPFDVFAIRKVAESCLTRRLHRIATQATLERLRASNDELNRELARSERAIAAGVLTAGVIHQLNHPLSIISGYSELLKADLETIQNQPDMPTVQITEKLNIILEEVEHCKEIATRLLAFGRRSQGFAEVVDISKLLEDTQALVKAHPEGRESDIRGEWPNHGMTVLAWPTELMQALINIGINALEARQGNRGFLHISARPVSAAPPDCVYRSEEATIEAPHVEITFRDNGCGIPKENLGLIFKPYFTTKTKGSGLGLAIARDIIGRHRGLIDIKSTEGKGTAVQVFLPQAFGSTDSSS